MKMVGFDHFIFFPHIDCRSSRASACPCNRRELVLFLINDQWMVTSLSVLQDAARPLVANRHDGKETIAFVFFKWLHHLNGTKVCDLLGFESLFC